MKAALITIIAIILAFAFWHFVIVIGWGESYSSGERTGQVYKLSEKGLFYKSFEGEMYLGGVSSVSDGKGNSSLVMDKFEFSIPESQKTEKADIIAKLNDCAANRKICTVHYVQWFKGPIDIETSYVVVGVDEK